MSKSDPDASNKPDVRTIAGATAGARGRAAGSDNSSHIFGEIRHNPEKIRELFRTGT
jgi:hypothetical protein